MIFFSSYQHFGFCYVYTCFCSKQVAEMLPKSDIIVILARRKLSHIKSFIRIYNISFRTCSS